MPCRDYGAEREFSEEQRKRLDALAQEACDAGKVAYILFKKLQDVDLKLLSVTFNIDKDGLINKVLQRYAEHRKCDKEAAKENATKKLLTVSQTIQKIRELGGEPKADLIEKHADAQNEVILIDKSDPLTTSLY